MDNQVLFDEVALHVSDTLGLKKPPMGQRFITSIAVEFMLKRYAPLVEASQFVADENFACGDHYCDWCGCMTRAAESLDGPLNNLKGGKP